MGKQGVRMRKGGAIFRGSLKVSDADIRALSFLTAAIGDLKVALEMAMVEFVNRGASVIKDRNS